MRARPLTPRAVAFRSPPRRPTKESAESLSNVPWEALPPLRLQGKAIQGTRWFRNKNLAKVDARSAWLEAYYPAGRPQRSTQKTADGKIFD